MEISQNFVAFSEYINFKKNWWHHLWTAPKVRQSILLCRQRATRLSTAKTNYPPPRRSQGRRAAPQFAAAATRWRQCAVPKSLSANFVSRLAKVQSNKGPWVYNFNWETSPGVVGRRKTQWTKSRDFCKQYKHIFF